MSTPAKPAGNIWGMLLLVLITLLLILLVPQRAQWDFRKVAHAETIEEAIRSEAKRQKVNGDTLVAIAKCESSLKHEGVVGDGGRAIGLYQFWLGTFNSFKEKYGHPEFSIFNMKHQIILAAYAARDGKLNHWVCYKKLKSN